ncbi:MAG: gliding motility-associated C-terminal domain-containing protein [Prevotellaceae bacterium]|jgi:gliding motility-associated-like protein|nr:gliding motility-associated C-terminal domain-containing protein [Prevotellaceae bacterium]
MRHKKLFLILLCLSAATPTPAQCPRSITLLGGATVCALGSSGQVRLATAVGVRVECWSYSSNALFSEQTDDYAAKTSYYPYSNLTQPRYFRVRYYDSVCNVTATSGVAEIKVDAVSVADSVGGAAEHCLGQANGTLTLSGSTSSVQGWQQREENEAWQNIAQTSTSLSYANLTSSTYYRSVVKNGVCPAATTDSVLVTVNPLPQAQFTVPDVCLSEASRFTDASTVSSGYLVSHEWNFGNGATSTATNPQHTYLDPITYAVTLKVTSSKGCTHQVQRETKVHVLPKADFAASHVCVGKPSVFTSLSSVASGENLLHTWRFNDEATANLKNPTHTFAADGSQQVWLWVQSELGGCKDSVEKTVGVYPLPLAYAGRDTTVELGYSVELSASGGIFYSWLTAPGIATTDVGNPVVAPTTATQYVVRVEDEHGCVAYDSVTVRVRDTQRVTPSTIITPDGNGENDTWVVRNIEHYPNARVRVLDARGAVVLDRTGYKNDWDVRNSNGDTLPGGTYYYIITFGDTGKLYKGAITVLR